MTWGYQRKEVRIKAETLIELTGLRSYQRLYEARCKLIKMNMIRVAEKGNNKHLVYGIQEDCDQWKPDIKHNGKPLCNITENRYVTSGKPLCNITENRYVTPSNGTPVKASQGPKEKRNILNKKEINKEQESCQFDIDEEIKKLSEKLTPGYKKHEKARPL